MANKKDLTFEKAYEGLEESVKSVSENKNLEETIKAYEEGIAYYVACKKILDGANQKIEVIQDEE